MSLDFARDREPAERPGGVTHPCRMGTRRANPPEADRWAFFSSLLVEEIECDLEGNVKCRQLLRAEAAYVVRQGTLR